MNIHRKYFLISVSICLVIGAIDIATSSTYRLYPFYLIPLYLIIRYTEYIYLALIIIISFASMVLSEFIHFHSFRLSSLWNLFMVLFMYIIFIKVLISLRKDSIVINKINSELSTQLNEKSLLIREIYHRQKNNIGSLISMTRLELKNNPDIMNLITNKLYVYAQLFELLCYGKTSEEIHLYNYLRRLSELISKSSESNADITIVEFDIMIKNETATSIGLILNELISNSIKHSTGGDRHIAVSISVELVDATLILMYSDNGIGFDFDAMNRDYEHHYGLFLIHSLVQQYHGDITYTRDNGSVFRISLRLK